MNRRDFFRDSAVTALALSMGMVAEELRAEPSTQDEPTTGPPVTCAVIGLGTRGREILASLAKLSGTPVAVVCDSYSSGPYIKRATSAVPNATVVDDYHKVLDDKAVQAVFVATPSHKHKQIVLDAIQAGKHVYCEAPLATDLDEARAIAKAGLASKSVFQAGLQYRSNKQHHHVLGFVQSAALGDLCGGRAQYHKKAGITDFKRAAPTPEREHDLNWRMYKESSSGLVGEHGIHQVDTATWMLKALPVSATGFGGVMHWKSAGFEVPDTVQCIIEYPGGVRYIYDATLANSFDGEYELLMGSDAAILIRDQRAWMFKETDSKLVGWEVFARKDSLSIGDAQTGVGIALVADATKLLAQGKQPGQVGTDVSKSALYQAIQSFMDCVRTGKKPAAGPVEGYQATVVARKTHDAVMSGSTIKFEKEWFDLS